MSESTERCLTHRSPRPDQTWRLADPGYRVCSSCFDRMRGWLAGGEEPVFEGSEVTRPVSIPGLYALLDATPGKGGEGRRGPGFGSRSPASDHVIVMTDRRSKSCEVARDATVYHRGRDENGAETDDYESRVDVWFGSDGKAYAESEHPVRSVPFVLGSWAQLVTEERGLAGRVPVDVAGLAEFLDRHLDWIARRDDVDAFHEDLRALRAQLSGDGQPPLGHCIELLEGGECGAPIFMPHGEMPRAPDEPITTLPELRCSACDSRYSGRRLILLRLNQERLAS